MTRSQRRTTNPPTARQPRPTVWSPPPSRCPARPPALRPGRRTLRYPSWYLLVHQHFLGFALPLPGKLSALRRTGWGNPLPQFREVGYAAVRYRNHVAPSASADIHAAAVIDRDSLQPNGFRWSASGSRKCALSDRLRAE